MIHFADCTVEEKVAVSWKEESKERRYYAVFCIDEIRSICVRPIS